jgi:hypothetical protein
MIKRDLRKVFLLLLFAGLSIPAMWATPVSVAAAAQTPAPTGGAAAAAGGGRGRGGLPGATPAQTQAVADMNTALAPLSAAAMTARNELGSVALVNSKDAGGITAAVEKLRAAELALAMARADAFSKLQAGPDRLTAEQVTALIATIQAGGAGGRGGGGRGPAVGADSGAGGRGAAPSAATPPTPNNGR